MPKQRPRCTIASKKFRAGHYEHLQQKKDQPTVPKIHYALMRSYPRTCDKDTSTPLQASHLIAQAHFPGLFSWPPMPARQPPRARFSNEQRLTCVWFALLGATALLLETGGLSL